MLPFGLALDRGITIQVDEGAVMLALRFRTPAPTGVPFAAVTLSE
ncbi:MAG: hypothetical protein ACYC0C_04915 [Devosia sp.]